MGNFLFRKSESQKSRKIYPSTNSNFNNVTNKYAKNVVRTQKYNIITFIPKNLFEQFHRFANVYFVFILILNFLPEITAFGKEVAPIPVVFVLSITAIKDLVEDFRRYKSDQKVNHSKCRVYSRIDKKFVDAKWSCLVCGDFVELSVNETIPADIVLLSSTDLSGTCHIETSNLDGESNLKQREVVWLQRNSKFEPESLSKYHVEVEYPNQEIYKFNGTLIDDNGEKTSLKKDNLLLRGCTLRNTANVIGIVVYAGKETKAMLNNKDTRFKRSKLERQINKDVIWCALLLIILCISGSLGNLYWSLTLFSRDGIEFYKLPDTNNTVIRHPGMQAFLTFWIGVIYYQALIPLPLYVTFEFVKLHQVFHIRKDLEMFDTEIGKGLEVRSLNIPEELGQIQYIFCDKTGTLTENRMEFKRAYIKGEDYSKVENPDANSCYDSNTLKSEYGDSEEVKTNNGDKQKHLRDLIPILQGDVKSTPENDCFVRVIKDFFILMAICNTTVVSVNKNDNKPVMKEKKPTIPDKIKKHLQKAERALGTAVSMSSFNAKFFKSDRLIIKNSENTEIESKSHTVELPPGMELTGFTRRESALPGLDKIANQLAFTRSDDILQPPDTSRKVKSVVDFKADEYNIYNDNQDHTTPLHIDFPNLHHSVTCTEFITDECDGQLDFNINSDKHECDNKCPISDNDLLSWYESESPDEMALVKTACSHGYKLLQRGAQFVTIWNPESESVVTYDVIQILPFDSNRKRMSVIVKCPQTNDIILYCKGADSAMFGRFSDEITEKEQEDTQDYLDAYARLGLRTLVMAKRVISSDYFSQWHKRYKAIVQSLGENEKQLSEITSEIENKMELLGISGIEDCLQDGVPDTIDCLRKAGINLWILTGDKRETAINIAYSAKLFSNDQKLLELTTDSKETTHSLIKKFLAEIEINHPSEIREIRQGKSRPLIRKDLALCVDGNTLSYAMDPDVKMDFLHLAEQCCSVVCARSTPIQKAEMVQLVKENLRMQTLAIGDGANDVSMIQMADVGVGIGGNEGMQAVMASDFAMTKFKYLKRLLLVHGSWSYNKLARTALYMFYKDTIYIMLMFWYQFYNTFSISIMYDQLTQILFNITMTGLPPIIYGIWDKDLHAETLMRNPELYRHGINCKSFKPWHFWLNILDAIWQSLAIFFICYSTYMDSDIGIWEFGQVLTACVLITCLVHLGVETRFWTIFHLLGLFISMCLAWLVFTIIYNTVCGRVVCGKDNPSDFIFQNFQRLTFWMLCFLTPAASVLPRVTVNAIRNSLHPDMLNKGLIREERMGKGANLGFDFEPELVTVRRKSTFFGSLLRRPSVAEINLINPEYRIPNTPNRKVSAKKHSISQLSTASGNINQSYINSKHTAYADNISNHINTLTLQPNVSPSHDVLINNHHAQQNPGHIRMTSNVNGGCFSRF